MPFPYDAALKDLVTQSPGDFAAAFDLPDVQPTRALNVDLSSISAATDVALGFGEPLEGVVDLNFQSGRDAQLPARVLLYNAALHARFEVAVESIVVLLRPRADAKEFTGKVSYGRAGQRLEFEYRVIRLWQELAETFLQGGLAVLPLAIMAKLPEDKPLAESLREVVLEIDQRLKQTSHAEAVRLMTAAYILSGLRVQRDDLASIFMGIGLMQESTAFDEAVEEGERRGKIQGKIEGKIEGKIDGLVGVLLRQGRARFGSPDKATEAELKSIQDGERLERLADAILTAESWQELLATP